jgi:hypothetical protein
MANLQELEDPTFQLKMHKLEEYYSSRTYQRTTYSLESGYRRFLYTRPEKAELWCLVGPNGGLVGSNQSDSSSVAKLQSTSAPPIEYNTTTGSRFRLL